MQIARMLQKEKVLTVKSYYFAAVIRKYVGVKELTPTIVNEFVKKIIVHAPDKSQRPPPTESADYLELHWGS